MNQLANDLRKAALLALALCASANGLAGEAAAPAGAAAPAVAIAAPAVAASTEFARIGDTVITHDDYSVAFDAATRAKFYHGKPPEAEVAKLQREVGEQMVTRILLLREARQRGLQPDAESIKKTLQSYEQRYAGSAQWKANRLKMLPPLQARLEEESLLTQLEQSVRGAIAARENDARAYYDTHQAHFTEPEQLRVSVILLKVDPSSPSATWVKADEQAQALAVRARAGEDFAALARHHSADPSAPQGGDMGYLHVGMLPDGAQEALAKLKPGETTDSLRLLQGLAVFRLTDRKPALLRAFDSVKERARDLALREQGERAWSGLMAALRAQTPVRLDRSRFLPLDEQASVRSTPE